MNHTLKNLSVAAALFCLMQPGYAFSQAAYDPSTGQASPNQSSGGHRHHKSTGNQPSSPSANPDSALRDADDRKLNSLANEYYHISAKSGRPVERLKELEKRVKEYHSTLTQRTYAGNADLIHDTVSLERRIEIKKKKLIEQEAKARQAVTPPAPVTPVAIPQAAVPVVPLPQNTVPATQK